MPGGVSEGRRVKSGVAAVSYGVGGKGGKEGCDAGERGRGIVSFPESGDETRRGRAKDGVVGVHFHFREGEAVGGKRFPLVLRKVKAISATWPGSWHVVLMAALESVNVIVGQSGWPLRGERAWVGGRGRMK